MNISCPEKENEVKILSDCNFNMAATPWDGWKGETHFLLQETIYH